MATDIHDVATDYSERGWALVPNILGTKQPLISKWQTMHADADAAHALFTKHPNSNIGIVLGAASGGIVDVDLDDPNAAVIADHLLPSTGLRFGRASKPNSHRLYRVGNPGRREAFIHPETGAMLVELRGNHHQTILPPSTHESGEIVSFAEGGENAEPATSDCKAGEPIRVIPDEKGPNGGPIGLNPNGDQVEVLSRSEFGDGEPGTFTYILLRDISVSSEVGWLIRW